MGEVVNLRAIIREREIARGRSRDRDNIQLAIGHFARNLEAIARQLLDAPAQEQPELIERAERLLAMIRYARNLLGGEHES
jgi:hypothetical protein